ncbi:lytic murein transglycosylase [Cohaesibacter celericrescens]|uniref:Lytic murein transglycosylase n=1 Tax=Cohaesibacter celericrescens TaxID=2067669 RepID=A0A2N5XWZ6_9HYPH|nr:lytic murein transglycosylase [Cohaesibacter celericrescens]PLW79022.1 lytic murein transglycosylase [Cohaesibacter celericrescens]
MRTKICSSRLAVKPIRFLLSTVLLLVAFTASDVHAQSEAGFHKWIKGYWPTARAAGVSASTYNAAFAGVQLDMSILKRANNQAEFVKPIWSYLDGAVSAARVKNGRKMKRKHGALLQKLEQAFGVDQHVLLAIWGMESAYGSIFSNKKLIKPTIQSLATLAYAGKRRSKFGQQQLLAALKILQNGDVAPSGMVGSWAGAMGHTQFIPTTYLTKAYDFDGDGRRNIWTSIPDALASSANLLKTAGWETGKTWGYEIKLPRNFAFELADGKTSKTLAEWQKLGAKRVSGRAFPRPDDQAKLILPAGYQGVAFLILKNFSVIKRYNNADAYALGVGHLADQIRGGGSFAGQWPRSDRVLKRSERKEVQTLLNKLGYDTGGVDGRLGSKSRGAIRHWQKRMGHVPDGFASGNLLEALRKGG